MRLTLRDVGLPYHQIRRGTKTVGRVYPKSDGTFGAVIGQGKHFTGATMREAFERAAAHEFGFNSPNEVRAHNEAIRRHKRAMRREVQYAVNTGDIEGLARLILGE